MASNIPDEEKPPTIEEQYGTAVGASNLRVLGERRTPADMVIAAGMNSHRLGMQLRRLATEWDAVGKPPRPNERNIESMAAAFPRIKGTGLVLFESVDRDGKKVQEQLPPLVAAQRQSEQWYSHELGLLFQRLKTLPETRAALVFHFQRRAEKGWHTPLRYPWPHVDDVPHVVAAVLQWWLSPLCTVCMGVKKRVIAGTGRTGSKDCSACRGSGQRSVPHSYLGRQVIKYMNECQWAAVDKLREKFQRPRQPAPEVTHDDAEKV